MNITTTDTAVQQIDIEALLQHAQQLANNRLSKNTLKAYRSALRGWAKFCTGTGIDPEQISAESLALYLTHLSSRKLRPATIDVHRAALRDVFKHRDKAAVFIDLLTRLGFHSLTTELDIARDGPRRRGRASLDAAMQTSS